MRLRKILRQIVASNGHRVFEHPHACTHQAAPNRSENNHPQTFSTNPALLAGIAGGLKTDGSMHIAAAPPGPRCATPTGYVPAQGAPEVMAAYLGSRRQDSPSKGACWWGTCSRLATHGHGHEIATHVRTWLPS